MVVTASGEVLERCGREAGLPPGLTAAGRRFDELREGQAVSFEKGQGPKGPRAENIRVG